jgi:hypothetical protein
MSPLQSTAGKYYVRFEVFMAVTMKNAIFQDVTPCGSWKNQCCFFFFLSVDPYWDNHWIWKRQKQI